MDETSPAERRTRPTGWGRRRAIYTAAAVAAAVILGWPQTGVADPMALVTSFPKANQTIGGKAASISLRFSGPIDHAASTLTLVAPDATRVLRARLDSRPNTLFAAAGNLRKGHYVLRWQVRGMDGSRASGEVPFEVGGGE
jgi:methionine-rich copper-binding protein CopC